MINRKISLFLILLLILSLPVAAGAGNILVNASLDSTQIVMGNVATLRLEVVQDKGVKGEFPILRNIREKGFAGLLNDTIEIRPDIKVDSAEIGSGRIQINYQMGVQVFDSGQYRIPGIVFVAGSDSASSKPINLMVLPVKVTADDPISPLTEVADPENPSIFDALPDWLVRFWWIFFIVPALIVAGIWAWKRYKQEGTLLPARPEKSPYEEAVEGLQRLKARKLWQSGEEKEFYTILTDILRRYLDRRFGIKAMEMTSREIMQTIADDPALRESRPMMRQILDMADFVKFAMVRPLPDDNVKAFDNALEFVEMTKPTEIPEDNQPGNQPADVASDAGNKNSSSLVTSISSKHLFKIAKKSLSRNDSSRKKGGKR